MKNLLSLLLLLINTSEAFATLTLKPVGSFIMHANSFTNTNPDVTFASITSKSKSSYGGGLLIEKQFSSFGIELGALYTPVVSYFKGVLSSPISMYIENTARYGAMEIPLLFRFHPSRFFSVGMGGYYQFNFGKICENVDSDQAMFQGSACTTLKEADMATNDMGLQGSLQGNLHLSARFSTLVDVRYSYGLKDQDIADELSTMKSRRLSILVGLGIKLN